jgi:serine/threonine-protein kinase
MPYMEGGTLRSWCGAAERRPTARALCAVLYQLTSVVAHVHQQRCVHRDIKPENVLMDASGRPRLADFEISLDQTSAITETLTTRGTPGTCLYMAPELRVPGAVATAASDMYALGVSFEQVAPLGDLTIRWTGSDDGEIDVHDEYDDYDEAATEGGEADGSTTAETEEIVE